MLRLSEKMFSVRSLLRVPVCAEFRTRLSLVIPINPEIPEKSHGAAAASYSRGVSVTCPLGQAGTLVRVGHSHMTAGV